MTVLSTYDTAHDKNNAPVFAMRDLTKTWAGGSGFVLKVPDLVISRGEKVALLGFSGCGKSTLLDILAMILKPDDSDLFRFYPLGGSKQAEKGLDVMNAWRKNGLDELSGYRMKHIGYVLQTGGLLPFLSVRENIGISRRGLGMPLDDTVKKLAERLGIAHHLDKKPGQLSVGERQRVAIARAMAHNPDVVIADEPTASLDPINADEIMKLFTEMVEEYNVTLIIATHDWDRIKSSEFRVIEFFLTKEQNGYGPVRAVAKG